MCRAFDVILHKGIIGEIYNIGCKHEYSVLDVAQMLIKHFNKGEIIYVEDRLFNDQRYFISCEKLEQLGWSQEILFDEALNKTIDWYVENQDYFNLSQIK